MLAGYAGLQDRIRLLIGRCHIEQIEQAIGELEMLAGPEHVDIRARFAQRTVDRTKLDDLRPGAEDEENTHVCPWCCYRVAVAKSSGSSWTVFDQTIGLLANSDSPR